MKIRSVFLFFLLCSFSVLQAQTFAPKPGEPGSTAIHKDSSVFQSWGDAVDIVRGWAQINDTSKGYATFGSKWLALGKAEGDVFSVVSLGDGGSATYYLNNPIINDDGPDFAIFENGFDDNIIELAFVEVSNDGVEFYRFPAYSETSTSSQKNNASQIDCRNVHNLAGKYKVGYGTPFDLQDLDSIQGLDLQNVRFVRIIDVVGSIHPDFGTYDAMGRIINDPWPTPFESSGFDLDALGLIHQKSKAGLLETNKSTQLFPNPFREKLQVSTNGSGSIEIRNLLGQVVFQSEFNGSAVFNLDFLQFGSYFVKLTTIDDVSLIKVTKE